MDYDALLQACLEEQQARQGPFSAQSIARRVGLTPRIVMSMLQTLEVRGRVRRVSPRLWRVVLEDGEAEDDASEAVARSRRVRRARIPLVTTVAPETLEAIRHLGEKLHLPSYGSVLDVLVAVYGKQLSEL
jgi:DNA-binding IclR family transcriptional regulator